MKKRFGNGQLIINALQIADEFMCRQIVQRNFERCLTTRAVFLFVDGSGENIETRQTVSIIRSKLPSNVLFQFGERNEGEPWTVKCMREQLGRSSNLETCPKRSRTPPRPPNRKTEFFGKFPGPGQIDDWRFTVLGSRRQFQAEGNYLCLLRRPSLFRLVYGILHAGGTKTENSNFMID